MDFFKHKWNERVEEIRDGLHFRSDFHGKPIPPPGRTMINEKETRESRQKREAWNLYMDDRKENF